MTTLKPTARNRFLLSTDDPAVVKFADRMNPESRIAGAGNSIHYTFSSPSAAYHFVEYAKNGAESALEAMKTTREGSYALKPKKKLSWPNETLPYLPFQQAGIEFMAARKRVLLADPPGLGKTIQIAGVLNELQPASALIVCPASLRLNWMQELEKWLAYAPRTLEIVSVDSVWRKGVFSRLMGIQFDFMAVDEAHYLKEAKSKRSMACEALARKTERVILMTGTPVKNRPKDLYNLLAILDDTLFPDYRAYALRYCGSFLQEIRVYDPATRKKVTRKVWNDSGSSNEDELNDILRSQLMLRRSKESALPQLPRKRRQIIEVGGGKASLLRDEHRAWHDVCEQIGYAEALERLESGAAIGFEALAKARKEVALSKVPFVVEHVSNLVESGEKVIVFAHHRDVVSALNEGLSEYNPVIYVGGMSEKQKDAARAKFMEDDSCRVFIGNIQAAGTGLTLTVSSTVVFAEMSYCPSEMEQCEDRACRIGQDAGYVLVQHVVLAGSLDVSMAHRLLEKQRVADAILADGSEKRESLLDLNVFAV